MAALTRGGFFLGKLVFRAIPHPILKSPKGTSNFNKTAKAIFPDFPGRETALDPPKSLAL
jgi:hypothetical protein